VQNQDKRLSGNVVCCICSNPSQPQLCQLASRTAPGSPTASSQSASSPRVVPYVNVVCLVHSTSILSILSKTMPALKASQSCTSYSVNLVNKQKTVSNNNHVTHCSLLPFTSLNCVNLKQLITVHNAFKYIRRTKQLVKSRSSSFKIHVDDIYQDHRTTRRRLCLQTFVR